jgi:hypothetical protein
LAFEVHFGVALVHRGTLVAQFLECGGEVVDVFAA